MAQLQMLYSEWLDQDLVGWIQVSLLSQSLALLLGFGANHSLLFIVQNWRHHIETRQIQYKHVPVNKIASSNLKFSITLCIRPWYLEEFVKIDKLYDL